MDVEAEFVYADILRTLQSSILGQASTPPSWEDDTDEFLKSMLTGSDLSGLGVSGSDTVCPSDTSSDSGCPEEQVRTLTSPGLDDGPCYTNAYTPPPPPPPSPANSLADLYLDDSDDQGPHEAVSPLDTVCDPLDQTFQLTCILSAIPIMDQEEYWQSKFQIRAPPLIFSWNFGKTLSAYCCHALVWSSPWLRLENANSPTITSVPCLDWKF